MYTAPEFNTIEDALKYAYDKTIEQAKCCCEGLFKDPVYRAEGGLKCTIGWLISDVYYDEELGSSNVGEAHVLARVSSSIRLKLNEEDVNYLTQLQYCHDECSKSDDASLFVSLFKGNVYYKVEDNALPDIFEECCDNV